MKPVYMFSIAEMSVDQQQHRKFFVEESISWCVDAMPASTPMRTPFSDLMTCNILRWFSFE